MKNLTPSPYDKFLSWARYLFWCDLLYQRYYEHDEADFDDTSEATSLTFALSSQWLASMYVVIEGWDKASLQDEVIDDLLSLYEDFVVILKRFRHGVFHYQNETFDSRFTNFILNGSESLLWSFALMYEFKRFYWQSPTRIFSDINEDEARKLLRDSIGWMPIDIFHKKIADAYDLRNTVLMKMSDIGDYHSAEAKELLAAVESLEQAARNIEPSPLLSQLPRFSASRKNADCMRKTTT
ncbi:MAG: hypothetical protein Tsb002_20800 [Wenzhouxiangellaceae bacterium]